MSRAKNPFPPPPDAPATPEPPFKIGDVVCLKSGGFGMTVVEIGHTQCCGDPIGEWYVGVVYAPDRLDSYPRDQWSARGGLLTDELEASILTLAPSRDVGDEIPF